MRGSGRSRRRWYGFPRTQWHNIPTPLTHRIASDGRVFTWMHRMDRIGDGDEMVEIFGESRSFPLGCVHLSRTLGQVMAVNGGGLAGFGGDIGGFGGHLRGFGERRLGRGGWDGWRDGFEVLVDYGRDGRRMAARGKCQVRRQGQRADGDVLVIVGIGICRIGGAPGYWPQLNAAGGGGAVGHIWRSGLVSPGGVFNREEVLTWCAVDLRWQTSVQTLRF